MKMLLKAKKYLALLISAVSLLTAGLIFALTVPAPAASQLTEESLGASQITSNGSQSQIIPPSSKVGRDLNVEFLYLDLSVCGPCQGTEATLDQAVSEVRPILEGTGFDITVSKILVENEAKARGLGFVSSPTIRINGHDIQTVVREKTCDSCSGLCGSADINCRVWVYQGEEYWAPPKSMIIDAILSEAYGGTKQIVEAPSPGTDLPDNLKRFFAAKEELKDGTTCCDPLASSQCCP